MRFNFSFRLFLGLRGSFWFGGFFRVCFGFEIGDEAFASSVASGGGGGIGGFEGGTEEIAYTVGFGHGIWWGWTIKQQWLCLRNDKM